MKKVNEQKLLQDYENLIEMQRDNLQTCREQAVIYAVQRGYDERRTEQFVEYVQTIEGGGLTEENRAKLDILSSYIFEDNNDESESKEDNLV